MFEQSIKENVSTHRGYVETGPAVWLRPQSKQITIGEQKLERVTSPINKNSIKVFDLSDYLEKKKQYDKHEISSYERSMAGWSDEFSSKWQTVLDEEIRAEKAGDHPQYAGLIEPTQFSTLKSTQRVVQVFTQTEEIHELLSTIRVINIDDLNGVAIYDLNSIDTDPIQRSGTHNLPYEVSAPDITKSVMEPLKYAWRVAFSTELALVNFDLPNLEQLVLAQINGKLDIRRTKDIAAIINAVGNVGTQTNWVDLNTAETRYANEAYEDVKELLTLLYNEKYGQAEFFGMHPNVWDAFARNIGSTQVRGLTAFEMTPVDYQTSFRRNNALFPGVNFVIDNLLSDDRIFTWRRDAIFHIFGGVRAVPFENREIGYFGTTFRTYFNTAKIKASLIKGGTGILTV